MHKRPSIPQENKSLISRGMRLEKPLLREWKNLRCARSPLCACLLSSLSASPRALRANANNANAAFVLRVLEIKFNF
jgi:hypothetical protein